MPLADGVYRTDDMTLATVLACKRFIHTLIVLNSTKGAWDFCPPPEREEEFDDLIEAYEEYRLEVEPRSFTQEYARIRNEMYGRLPRRRSVAPSANAI